MLRTTANALWSRFVPAARQHITGATVASASRVSVRTGDDAATPSFRTALCPATLIIIARFTEKYRLTFPPSPHSARSSHPPRLGRRMTTRSTNTRYVGVTPLKKCSHRRQTPTRRTDPIAQQSIVRCSDASLIPSSTAPFEPVRAPSALRIRAVHRRVEGGQHPHGAGGIQDGT